ncbi:MAG TPA: hypothetical protein VLT35_00025 [Methanocella sp.]|nr:hypothetical protein [Methanocella sp.]
MTVKAIVEWSRAIPGCLGTSVYAGDALLYSEGIEPGHAASVRATLEASPDAVRFCAVVRGVSFIAFRVDGLTVLLRVAGRFPALPRLRLDEPEFVCPAAAPALPSREKARQEAGALLRELGLI